MPAVAAANRSAHRISTRLHGGYGAMLEVGIAASFLCRAHELIYDYRIT